MEQKNIVCDACGRSHLQNRFHLNPNLDICLECANNIKDKKLSVPHMRHFVEVVRTYMKWTLGTCTDDEDEDDYFMDRPRDISFGGGEK